MGLTKEDLQAIGALMDDKLEPIKDEISELKTDVKHIKTKVDIFYDWVDGIDLKVKELQKIV